MTTVKTRKPRATKSEIFAKKATKFLQNAVKALDGLAGLTEKYHPNSTQTEVILNAVNTSFSDFQDAYSTQVEEVEEVKTNELTVPVE